MGVKHFSLTIKQLNASSLLKFGYIENDSPYFNATRGGRAEVVRMASPFLLF